MDGKFHETEVPRGRSGMIRNVSGGGGRRGSVEEEGRRHSVPAAAGRLHAGNTRSRHGEAAVSAAGTAAAHGGAAAVAEAAVGLLP